MRKGGGSCEIMILSECGYIAVQNCNYYIVRLSKMTVVYWSTVANKYNPPNPNGNYKYHFILQPSVIMSSLVIS